MFYSTMGCAVGPVSSCPLWSPGVQPGGRPVRPGLSRAPRLPQPPQGAPGARERGREGCFLWLARWVNMFRASSVPGSLGHGEAEAQASAASECLSGHPDIFPASSRREGRFGKTCPVCLSVLPREIKVDGGLTVALRADGGRPSQGPARAWPSWLEDRRFIRQPRWPDFTGHSPQRCPVKPLLPGPGLTGLLSPLLLFSSSCEPGRWVCVCGEGRGG